MKSFFSIVVIALSIAAFILPTNIFAKNGGSNSWKYEEIRCWDETLGREIWVSQCDAANGTCTDQYCGCGSHK